MDLMQFLQLIAIIVGPLYVVLFKIQRDLGRVEGKLEKVINGKKK